MTPEDFDRLIKFLNLTASDFDGEVLNSIRAANRLLAKHGKRWEDLIQIPRSESEVSIQSPHDRWNDFVQKQQAQAYQNSNPFWWQPPRYKP